MDSTSAAKIAGFAMSCMTLRMASRAFFPARDAF
jgi:hypothetical protein